MLRNDKIQDDVRHAMELAQEYEERDGGDHLWYLQQRHQASNACRSLTSADLTSNPHACTVDAHTSDRQLHEPTDRLLDPTKKPKDFDEL